MRGRCNPTRIRGVPNLYVLTSASRPHRPCCHCSSCAAITSWSILTPCFHGNQSASCLHRGALAWSAKRKSVWQWQNCACEPSCSLIRRKSFDGRGSSRPMRCEVEVGLKPVTSRTEATPLKNPLYPFLFGCKRRSVKQ